MIILYIILVIITIAFLVGIVSLFAEIFTKSSTHKAYGPYERFIKRPLDAFLATGALIVLSPILLITALLVRIKLGSPIFFHQQRAGKDGLSFHVFKFRTMTSEKDEKGNYLPDEIRLTSFGKKLRATSLA